MKEEIGASHSQWERRGHRCARGRARGLCKGAWTVGPRGVGPRAGTAMGRWMSAPGWLDGGSSRGPPGAATTGPAARAAHRRCVAAAAGVTQWLGCRHREVGVLNAQVGAH